MEVSNMICKNCGFDNEQGKAFCANCGASLDIEDAQQESTASPVDVPQDDYSASPFDAPQDYSTSYDVSEDYAVPPYDEAQDYSTPLFEAEAYNPGGNKKNNEKLPLILGAVSLGLTILSSCCCTFIPIVNYIAPFVLPVVSLGLAIAAIVLGSKAMKQAKLNGEKDKFATIGLALGAVTVALAIIGLIIAVVVLVVGGAGLLAGMSGSGYYY